MTKILRSTEAQVRDGLTHLGGVEVHAIVLLVSCQILVCVVGGGPHQHHPVAVLFTAGVVTHHNGVVLEDLPIGGWRMEQKKKHK